MNPGLPEEAGKVAQGIISGLASTPVLLGLMLFNLFVLGGVFYLMDDAISRNDTRSQRMEELIRTCMEQKK